MSNHARHSRRGVITAAAVALAVIGILTIGWGVLHQVGPPPMPSAAAATATPDVVPTATPTGGAPSPQRSAKPSAKPTVKPTPKTPTVVSLDRSAPTKVDIPKIGVDATMVDLGIDDNGELETPSRYQDIGWFTGGPTPGSDGGAVLAGHVTYNGAKGVFYRLGDLDPGDKIRVTRADGKVAVFSVTATKTYPKDDFPTGEIYGAPGGPSLRLVTCGGDFDAARHYYPDNVVVFATMTSVAG